MSTFEQTPKRRTILVTGCSSGIGLAFAQALAETHENNVVITARERSYLTLLKHFKPRPDFWVRPLDITVPSEGAMLVEEINQRLGGVDVLINNAGISYRSVVEHMDDDSEMHQLKTNYLGPLSLIRAVFPTMREKRHGHIINISSVSGMMAMPTMASYSASKHALEGASEALWYEARPFGVYVSVIQLGFVNSTSFRNVLFSKKALISKNLDGPYADVYSYIGPFIERLMGASRATPLAIAARIMHLIDSKNPPLWVPMTIDAKLFAFLRKVLPRTIFHKLMYQLLPESRKWGRSASKPDSRLVSEQPFTEILTRASISSDS